VAGQVIVYGVVEEVEGRVMIVLRRPLRNKGNEEENITKKPLLQDGDEMSILMEDQTRVIV